MADRTRPSRQGRQIQREVRSGHVRKYRSRDRLTIIPTSLASRQSGFTESRGTGLVLGLLRLDIPEPILVDTGRLSAHDRIDSQDGEYEDYNGQSEKTEVDEVEEEEEEEKKEEEEEKEKEKKEEEEEEELEQGEENENLSSGWRAPRSIWYGLGEPQPSIHTVTPGHTQSSGRGIDYTRRRAPVPVRVSPNRFTSVICTGLPTGLGPLETPAITPSNSGPTTPELDSVVNNTPAADAIWPQDLSVALCSKPVT